MPALGHLLACIAFHFAVLSLLTLRRSQQSIPEKQHATPFWASSWVIGLAGLLVAIYTLLLPYLISLKDPLNDAGFRCVCFFYACKLLDLALTKAHSPPVLKIGTVDATSGVDSAMMERWQEYARYMWLLLAEMRYHSFDIAVVQNGRQTPVSRLRSVLEPATVSIVAGAFAFLLDSSALRCLCLLMILQAGFETLHIVVHPGCQHPLFYRTLSASSMGAFWTTHWHACANSWLHSLAYQPGRLYVGRWFGVLATFSLSGVWHAWASAAVVDEQHASLLGIQVWTFFVLMGVVCLAERWIWGNRQDSVVQKVVVWSIALLAAGRCFRTLQSHSKIEWLRSEHG